MIYYKPYLTRGQTSRVGLHTKKDETHWALKFLSLRPQILGIPRMTLLLGRAVPTSGRSAAARKFFSRVRVTPHDAFINFLDKDNKWVHPKANCCCINEAVNKITDIISQMWVSIISIAFFVLLFNFIKTHRDVSKRTSKSSRKSKRWYLTEWSLQHQNCWVSFQY